MIGSDSQNGVGSSAITGRAGQLGRPRHGRCDRHTCVLWVICSRPPAIAMTMTMTMATMTTARVTPMLIHATIFAAVLSPPSCGSQPSKRRGGTPQVRAVATRRRTPGSSSAFAAKGRHHPRGRPPTTRSPERGPRWRCSTSERPMERQRRPVEQRAAEEGPVAGPDSPPAAQEPLGTRPANRAALPGPQELLRQASNPLRTVPEAQRRRVQRLHCPSASDSSCV